MQYQQNYNEHLFILIGNPRRIKRVEALAPLKLNGTEIKRVKTVKSLGVIVDENLSWKENIKSVKGKVRSGLSSLKKLKNILPQSKLLEIHLSMVESYFLYGNIVWGSLPNSKLQTFRFMQDRAFSIIENAEQKDNLF